MTDLEKQQIPPEKGVKREYIRSLGVASTIGANFVISACVGLGIGWVLDNKVFNTFPWFTIIFLILGIAAGFKHLFKFVSKISDYYKESDESSTDSQSKKNR